MTTPFTYRIGLADQGRIQPTARTVSADDNPTPALARTLVQAPFALIDADDFLVAIDNGATQSVSFVEADFVDISVATAPEVAAVLNGAGSVPGLEGITAVAEDGYVEMTTVATGLSARIDIKGGSAQTELSMVASEQGSQGTYSLVLGHETEVLSLTETGDEIEVSQTSNPDGAAIVQLIGHMEWRPTVAGHGWGFALGGDGGEVTQSDPAIVFAGMADTMSLDDVAVNISGIAAGNRTISIRLYRDSVPAFAATVALPAMYVDSVEIIEDADAPQMRLANRMPTPAQEGIPHLYPDVQFMILNTDADPIDTATLDVYVNGQPVLLGGAFQAGYAGTVVAGLGLAARDVMVTTTGSGYASLPSESEVFVAVHVESVGGFEFDTHYSFFLADIEPPWVTEVITTSLTTATVRYNEPVKMTTDTDGALNPENYTIEQRSAPSVPLAVSSVVMLDDSAVSITYDTENSMGATYRLAVTSVEDIQDNVIEQPFVDYLAFRRQQPAGRLADLWRMLPEENRRVDTEGLLRKLILCFQDVHDLLLDMVDQWPQVWQVDKAPEPFLDAILAEMGNPFAEMATTYDEKRRLVGVLTTIYRQKGTAQGIINAVRFFVGIDVEIDVFNQRENFWELGFDQLGIETFVAPGKGDRAWYSFWVVSPLILTDDDRTKVIAIADYMKPGHTHILGIQEPGTTSTTADYWSLGVGSLGITTVLGA